MDLFYYICIRKQNNKELTFMPKGFYYILNTIDEQRTAPYAFFETLAEAKEAMKTASDWYCSKGTGSIYFQPFGKQHKAVFILRGHGLDDKGEVIWENQP